VQTSPVERDFASLDPSSLVPGSGSGLREYAFPVATGGYAIPAPTPEVRPADHASRQRVLDGACRALNFLVALVAVILCLPVMIVLAVAVRLSSPGPIFYVQDRVGVDRRRGGRSPFFESRRQSDNGGRVFKIYKFRTMRVEEPGAQKQVWAAQNDPRITPMGRILRQYRLDELPQLLNVHKGDMNVVGPRPEQPRIFKELRKEVKGYSERQKVLPGITGWAQINHHYDQSITDVERKVGLDLEYISRRSLVEDLKIMARTVPVMVLRRGSM
jgi:lipopolysaccharide/colanic/teichoic acid biosynthesis glycosyltransferase